jgi:squamous cell carcinoma antigen recognized by T-cells 3
MPEAALQVWEAATKHYKNSYVVWTTYTDLLVRQNQYDKARSIFNDLSMKNLDWPEAIWEAWLGMEHLHGSLSQLQACMDKIERAQGAVNARRIKASSSYTYFMIPRI